MNAHVTTLNQAHMVGKWHLGHAQPKQGPIGRGFQTHTGMDESGGDAFTH